MKQSDFDIVTLEIFPHVIMSPLIGEFCTEYVL